MQNIFRYSLINLIIYKHQNFAFCDSLSNLVQAVEVWCIKYLTLITYRKQVNNVYKCTNVLSSQNSHKYSSSEIQKVKTRHCDTHL